MNAGKMIISLATRSYRTRRNSKRSSKVVANPGIQGRLNVLEKDVDKDFESIEDLDLEEEPDFMHAHKSYNIHQKELAAAKEKLKLRIVARKYFHQVEPSFLTYMEKEQIRYLNSTDPIEYTPEKLSESFPSLPHAIRKVIKAQWTPRSADQVLKYDQNVIENWKKFKSGELQVEPRLREHLERFKNRKISLPNKEEIERKFIPLPPNFPKPKSQLYSSIIQNYLEREQKDKSNDEHQRISSGEKSGKESENDLSNKVVNDTNGITKYREPAKDKLIFEAEQNNHVIILKKDKSSTINSSESKGPVTLDEFFVQSVRKIDDTSSIDDKFLMDTYKQRVESKMEKVEDADNNRLTPKNLKPRFEEKYPITTSNDNQIEAVDFDDSKKFGLETYVKMREKKESEDNDYPESIKIPKNKYDKRKVYQLGDCYYDHDGEFLYKVPGFKG